MKPSYWKSLTYTCMYFSSLHLKCKHRPKIKLSGTFFSSFMTKYPTNPWSLLFLARIPYKRINVWVLHHHSHSSATPNFLGHWSKQSCVTEIVYKRILHVKPQPAWCTWLGTLNSPEITLVLRYLWQEKFCRRSSSPSNGLLRNICGWERDTGNQSVSRLRVKRFWAVAKAPKVFVSQKFPP